jgi:DNA-binding NarL/FixJ family response regulator
MIRILIAEDHDVVRFGLRTIMEEQAGWEVVAEAADGLEAVKKARATRSDVVVLDYALPVLNGIEATRQIRARAPTIEILILAMHDTDALMREVLEAGARGFLLKSDPKRLLISAVDIPAAHKPFFIGMVSETLLDAYLANGAATEPLISLREKSVVQLIAEGRTNNQIAELLNISPENGQDPPCSGNAKAQYHNNRRTH